MSHASDPAFPVALSIAGSDSGGGAGIQADLKTFHQFGVFGTSVVTAITAQNTVGVAAWEPCSLDLVSQQIDALAEDLPPNAVKSGMLGSAALVEVVSDGMTRHAFPQYVLDPVMVATSGDRLLHRDAEQRLVQCLVPLAALVTPNRFEAEILTGRNVRDVATMQDAGRHLLDAGPLAILIKGGHLDGPEVTDVLMTADGTEVFRHERLDSTSTHGTGCTLSAAITARLAQGASLMSAVESGLDFVHRAIRAAPGLGSGRGPLNHFVQPSVDG